MDDAEVQLVDPPSERDKRMAEHFAAIAMHASAIARAFDPSVTVHRAKDKVASDKGGDKKDKKPREPTQYNLACAEGGRGSDAVDHARPAAAGASAAAADAARAPAAQFIREHQAQFKAAVRAPFCWELGPAWQT